MRRPRALLVAGIAIVIGAAVVDVVAPAEPRAPSSERVDLRTGTLACPVGTRGSSTAYVHLANIADEPARISVHIASDRGENVFVNADLKARATRTVRVSNRVKGDAAVFVDHAGGNVVASHSLWRSLRASNGVAAGVCRRAGDAQVVLPHGATALLDTTVVVANPGTNDADVTISLLREGRSVTPESLTRRVIPARSRRLYRLSDFVFGAADVTAVLDVSAGRVVAESIVALGSEFALLGGAPAERQVLLPLDASGDGRALSLASIGEEEESGIDARALRTDQQGRAQGVPPSIDPAASVRLSVAGRLGEGPVAYAFEAVAGSPVAAAGSWRRVSRGNLERASVEALAPARRWGGVLASVQGTADTRVLLVNAGASPARVTLTTMGTERARSIEVVVPAGRILVRRVQRGQGTFAVHAVADAPIVMAMATNLGAPVNAVAAVPAVPLDPPGEVAVIFDPRIGVPAPLTERSS